MAEKKILKLVLPGSDGINSVLDVSKIDSATDDLKKRVEWLESGSRQFALVDYSQPQNQTGGEMQPGVYYYVPFDADGVFIQLGEDGKPTSGKQIHHFDIYFKQTDGTVNMVQRQNTEGNLENVAYTDRLAVFNKGIQKATNASSWADIADDKELVSKGEVELHTAPITATLSKVTNVIGENAENAALKNAENTFTEVNTFNKGIKFSTADVNNISMQIEQDAATGAQAPIGINTTLMTSDAKKLASVVVGADAGNKKSVTLAVNKNDGAVAGAIKIEAVGDTVKATAPSITDFDAADDAEIVTKKVLSDKIGSLDPAHVAYTNKENTFTQNQKISGGGSELTLGGEGLKSGADTDLHLGAGTHEVVVSSTGNVTRPAMPEGAGETEVTTKKYVDDAVAKATIPDATTEAKGKVELATDDEVTQGADGVVPTAKQVRKAVDDKIQVLHLTDVGQATTAGVLYLVIED